MNMRKYKEFMRRYDKFKKNNLPTPFYDDERQTHEYVYYNENIEVDKRDDFDRRIMVSGDIVDALENITWNSFYYSYSCRFIIENNQKVSQHTHAHDFKEVVRDLYDYPESFNVSEDEEEFYSKQELDYLRKVQKYLLFIGMKDIKDGKRNVSRYRNKLQKKYGHAFIYKYSNERVNDFISGKINFKVNDWYDGFDDCYKDKNMDEFYALITDENNDFRLYVKYTYYEVKTYKVIKDIFKVKDLKDNDKVVLTYFEIIEKF